MTIKKAKENIMKNWRANCTADHMDNHDKEVFLLNAMEQLESVVSKEVERESLKSGVSQALAERERILGILDDFNLGGQLDGIIEQIKTPNATHPN